MMLWKAADKADPPDVQITDYGWEVQDNGQVMPVLSKESIAPEQLMDVISCSCRAKGKACSLKCSCAANGLSCTTYCVCEGGDECCNALTQRADYVDEDAEQDEGEEDLEKGDNEDDDNDMEHRME